MRRFIIAVAAMFCILAGTAAAQPKSVGIRAGYTGLNVNYQHFMIAVNFIEADLGLDFGYNANGNVGVKAAGTYNIVWARPAWTEKGSWALYAGPGISLGYVDDQVPYQINDVVHHYFDNGFMMALNGQVGIEYNFPFPLQVSLDIRPEIGFHINDGRFRIPNTQTVVKYEKKIGFYDNGLNGLFPTFSLRYRF